MNMRTKNIFIILLGLLSCAFVGCEDKIDPLITELNLERVLSPVGLKAIVRNKTAIELTWDLREDADHYVVEFSEDSLEFNTIIFSDEVTGDELPYQHNFAGETRYSARVKAISSEGIEDSKWSTVTIATAQENIFLPLPGENV